jgi:hypothetical protein
MRRAVGLLHTSAYVSIRQRISIRQLESRHAARSGSDAAAKGAKSVMISVCTSIKQHVCTSIKPKSKHTDRSSTCEAAASAAAATASTKVQILTPELPPSTKVQILTPAQPPSTKVPILTPELPPSTKVQILTPELPRLLLLLLSAESGARIACSVSAAFLHACAAA